MNDIVLVAVALHCDDLRDLVVDCPFDLESGASVTRRAMDYSLHDEFHVASSMTYCLCLVGHPERRVRWDPAPAARRLVPRRAVTSCAFPSAADYRTRHGQPLSPVGACLTGAGSPARLAWAA